MEAQKPLLLAFYGDDFTGSTDALEFLTLAGVKTILFLKKPTAEDIADFPEVQAIGVAGKSRSMSPAEMEDTLYNDFENLKSFHPAHIHYKVCSTFDSTAHVGNIGKAIEIGSSVFNQKTTFVSAAAPHLGRYCVFGNLFAKLGTVGESEIYRIDKHPSMSKHPVTPSKEGDLREHLAKQTIKSIGLVPVNTIEEGTEAVLEAIKENNEKEILFFDGLNTSHLQTIGNVFHQQAKDKTLFSVGSSGIEMALGLAWEASNTISKNKIAFNPIKENGPLLVISGSCSPVTAGQINNAIVNGFVEIRLQPNVVNAADQDEVINATVDTIVKNFKEGKSCVVHTSIGPDDARIAATESALLKQGISKNEIQKTCSSIYGRIMGQITKRVLQATSLKRVIFAGGDTSSYAASELNIKALEMIAPMAPGAPLCRVISENNVINGIEVNFKGGQVGTPDYFSQSIGSNK